MYIFAQMVNEIRDEAENWSVFEKKSGVFSPKLCPNCLLQLVINEIAAARRCTGQREEKVK